VATEREPVAWQQVAIFALPWVTLILGTLVVMAAVSAHARGQTIGIGHATWRAVPYVPRYVWTNAHTSLIFWLPAGLLLWLRDQQENVFPLTGSTRELVDLIWWAVIGAFALYMHTRTLLAPFLAVHADLPGTLAALEAWRLSGRALGTCLTLLMAGSLPVALPLALVALGVQSLLSPELHDVLLAVWPYLAYAGVQMVRPVLIPGAYLLCNALWAEEHERRAREGQPRTPGWARGLLALTRGMPNLHRRYAMVRTR
jgi:hypothetical protein